MSRFAIRPGISGPWQVSRSLDLAPQEKLDLDFNYVQQLSWSTDFCLFLKTMAIVFMGERHREVAEPSDKKKYKR